MMYYLFHYRSPLSAWQLLFLLKLMPMLGMDMVVIFTNKPGLEHVDLASKVPVTDAVSQLTTSLANVKPKPNHITDTDMVVMDTDMDTDMVMVMDMVTPSERDLLNLTTDTHMLLAHTFLLDHSLLQLDQLVSLDTELEPHSPPEAHKDSEARDPLNHTTVMDSTDTVHTDTVQESLDTQVQLPPTLKEAYKELANRS